MSGDVITSIDDEQIQGLTLDQAVNKMKGAPNSSIRLKIVRKDADKPIELSITREIIRVRPVKYHVEGGDIGYVRITSFNEQTTDGLRKAIGEIQKEVPQDKLAGYVVDLRNNPGGLLDQAVRLLIGAPHDLGFGDEPSPWVDVPDQASNTALLEKRSWQRAELKNQPEVSLSPPAGGGIIAGRPYSGHRMARARSRAVCMSLNSCSSFLVLGISVLLQSIRGPRMIFSDASTACPRSFIWLS